MDALTAAFLVFGLLLFFLGTGVWVFAALLATSIAALHLGLDFPFERIGAIAKGVLWRASSGWELAAIPMFILMGELIFRTDLSTRLFAGLEPLVARVPGRLYHANIIGCTLFAAVSGSSTATTATVGRMTAAALRERRYDSRLAVGSLAGAGSLGLLIPPSIMMIIYGVLAEVSISQLFIAGLLPGLLVAGLYSAYIAGRCLLQPRLAPRKECAAGPLLAPVARGLAPIAFLIVVVLGGIYSGIATPSEAAAVGVLATLVLTLVLGQLSWPLFSEALLAALKSSCMIATILAAAALLSATMGYLHVPATIAQAIGGLGLGPWGLILLLALFYILLGFFLDGISIVVMTLGITLPLVQQAGFDPLWYGVFLVLMVELGLMTPPVGFNLFVLQSVTGQPLAAIARAAVPFFILMLLAAAILTAAPGIALWLPSKLG